MITVHHLNNSRSQRVLWLLEELGIRYQIKHYMRDARTSLAPPELRAVHPLGKSPVITDDGTTVAESGAIIEYLVGKYGKGTLRPAEDTPERLRYTYWLHYAEGTLMPLLVMRLIVSRIPKAVPALLRPVGHAIVKGVEKGYLSPNIQQNLAYIESELGRSPWFAGSEFSAADVQMSFPLEAAAVRAGAGALGKNIQDFLERIHARPAYQRALKAGGPYELLR